MTELLIAVIAVIVLVWVDALRAREAALRACRRATQRFELQLLDETVALRRLRPARTRSGRVGLRRHYSFEYSVQGNERRQGEIVMLGRHVQSVRGDWIDVTPTPSTTEPSPLPESSTPTPAKTPGNLVKLSDYRSRRAPP
ncbi:DUF3301 domain-containing protein [Acidihalobacter ferrooxydans]|uniref:DUF3301 domain-containing protein n=1 Tax=Acidihalobacter ferrooxydans TaxID=1765967 RepID=A0A1P8UKD7_9GAMM|nr:DUF3301 domain-containing protein [Acidihalobacter ferrooxydans]APZ44222.1 hypothetical protein BW247_14935 [Acidihalobacter ferrooxydans]